MKPAVWREKARAARETAVVAGNKAEAYGLVGLRCLALAQIRQRNDALDRARCFDSMAEAAEREAQR